MKISAQKGFTLLEILLVLVLMGLASSAVIPTINVGNSSVQLENQARQFGLQAEMTGRLAWADGRDLGLQLTDDGYRFLYWGQDKWQPLEDERYLQASTVDEAIEMNVQPGSSHWQAALEYENRAQKSLLQSDFAKPSTSKERYEPDLHFWSSGEVSPADISFCFTDSQHPCWWVMVKETGEVTVSRETRS